MTLAISFFDPSAEDEDEAYRGLAEPYLFGWESWRRVWGSDELYRRGSKFLVRLRESDLCVYPIDIGSFRDELESVRSASRDIAKALGIGEDDLLFRVQNALSACTNAEQNGFGICIS